MEGERSAPDMHRWYSVLKQVNGNWCMARARSEACNNKLSFMGYDRGEILCRSSLDWLTENVEYQFNAPMITRPVRSVVWEALPAGDAGGAAYSIRLRELLIF